MESDISKTEQGDPVPKDERNKKKNWSAVAPPKGEAPLLNGIKQRVMATTRGAGELMTTARQSVGELERSRHIPLKVSDVSDTAAAVLTDKHETKRTNPSQRGEQGLKKPRPNLKATSTHHAPVETK